MILFQIMPPAKGTLERRSSRLREKRAISKVPSEIRKRDRAPSRKRKTVEVPQTTTNSLPIMDAGQVLQGTANQRIISSTSLPATDITQSSGQLGTPAVTCSDNDNVTPQNNSTGNDVYAKIDLLTTAVSTMKEQLDEMASKIIPGPSPSRDTTSTNASITSNGQGQSVPILENTGSSSSSDAIEIDRNSSINTEHLQFLNMSANAKGSESNAVDFVPTLIDIQSSRGSQTGVMSNNLQSALPLGSNVTEALKVRIWANDYVDLGSLVNINLGKANSRSLVIENNKLALADNSKRIKSIDTWASAFNTFITIYCVKHPHAYPDMIKYSEIVRDMCRRKGNWYQYDIDFRSSKCQLQVSWGQMHHQLWLTHMFSEENRANNQDGKRENASLPRVPIGYCVRFHKGEFCRLPCQFNHRCYICNQMHPAVRCMRNTQGDDYQFQSPSFENRFFRPQYRNPTRNQSFRPPRGYFQPPRFSYTPRFNKH